MASPPSRERSLSPPREPEPRKSKTSGTGFKWKEKRPRDSVDRPERGYRDRYDRDDRYRSRAEWHDDKDNRRRSRSRSPRSYRGGRDGRRLRDEDEADRRQESERHRRDERRRLNNDERPSAPLQRNTDESRSEQKQEKRQEKKEKQVRPAGPSEAMIVVNINDRLGTKAAIPCLASDSIKAFKAIVAAHIGRKPHEILLKRQGERPFKDQLTLQDYGVSNGVQLDLELDTGD